jgi:23S rRNA pseudouridine1911/1915/1917 synthase
LTTDPADIPPALLRVDGSADGLRADAFLARELPTLSRTRIRQKIQMGESLLNGRRFATSTRLREGELITMTWRGTPPRHGDLQLPILYEDAVLVAVDKPAGVASHPVGGRQSGTVVQFARQRYAAEIRASIDAGDPGFYPTLANRLDVLSSGIVLIAKTRAAHAAMQVLMVQRLVTKEYLVLVEGSLKAEAGVIDAPIGFDDGSAIRVKMACRPDGRASVTEYSVVRRLPAHTLVRAIPRTGRQHQIRVHFASLGHPVVGDLLYKDEQLFLRFQGVVKGMLPPRQALHAAGMRFLHPFTSRPVSIECPPPQDFLAMVAAAERDAL